MKEPTKYSMESGLPVDPSGGIKKYPMSEGAEASFLKFIADQEESRKKYNERLEKLRQEQENKDKEGFYE